ncbi:MAG: DNA topoisomerase VI subunit B [Nanoarchaeota archaeon]|nr:DNA topoisomerase VI subunit B [Nanoarchaeota archaeon]
MTNTIAEELAKKQQAISVSEFFTRNRHLLGFDNPRRALLTTIKEAVDNSLTEDMPLMIKKKGITKIVKIGRFIDNYIEKNKKNVLILRGGNLEKLRLKEDVEVISFDRKTLKTSFKKVSCLFRHKPNSEIFRLRLESGRYIDLTPYHSVFTFRKGMVCSVKLNELKIGDPIIVPKKNWITQKRIHSCKLNILEELIKLDKELTKKINVYGVSNIFNEEVIAQIKSILPREKWYKINDFKKLSYIPLNILRELLISPEKFDDSKIGFSLSRNKIPCILKLNNDFAQLMGFYIAEGSTLSNLEKVYFSFGNHEKEITIYVKDLIQKVFDLNATIIKAHTSALNVTCYSKIMAFVMKYVFKFGTNARTKKISEHIWNLNYDDCYAFLLAYLAGDGYPSKKIFELLKNNNSLSSLPVQKITLATISEKLFVDLQYLISSLGLSYSIGYSKAKKRFIYGKCANFSSSNYIFIYTKQKKSNINKLPVSESILYCNDPQLKHSISRENQTNVYIDTLNQQITSQLTMLHEGVELFLSSDLGVLAIKNIEKIKYNGNWVYDISVPSTENFLAGTGPIFCHNSLDACQDAKVLPSVKIKIKQLEEERFSITVEDNGPGIVRKQIPPIFARLLYGSKFFTLRQQRGQQGIGISAAVLYSQLTTGKPAKITSKIEKNRPANYYELSIDTKKNEPKILVEKEIQWDKDQGTKIELEIEAIYQKGARSVDDYLKQTAIANPHAEIIYFSPDDKRIVYPRASEELPKEAKEIKPHPHGIELGIFIAMLNMTKAKTLTAFFKNDFIRVSPATAKKVCESIVIGPNTRPNKLNRDEAEKLYKAIQGTKLIAPPTNCLSPIGVEALQDSFEKEIPAEFFASVTRPAAVYRGNPFQIEACIAYGGQLPQDKSIQVLRFANRVPLQYQPAACAITKSAIDTNWRGYGLSQSRGSLPIGPIIIAIHVVSVWVPFTSESKEAIAHYPEIIKQIKLAIQECGRKLATYIRKTVKVREQKERANLFEKYIPEVASSLSSLTKEKKEKISSALEKMLKRSLKDLIPEEEPSLEKNPREEKNNVKGKNKREKQTTLKA